MRKDKDSQEPEKIAKYRAQIIAVAEDALINATRLETLRNAQLDQQLALYSKHLKERGHVFGVDSSSGETLLDAFGLPIPIKLPNPQKEGPDSILKCLEILRDLLVDASVSEEKKVEISNLVEEYKHILKAKKNE